VAEAVVGKVHGGARQSQADIVGAIGGQTHASDDNCCLVKFGDSVRAFKCLNVNGRQFQLLLRKTAGAMIGYFGIPLEAGIATVFSIVFGIATDDTIHFLSAFKLCRERKMSVEESLRTTLLETGKAMTLGSIILFFSFLVMLFSIHPPSVIVGLLVSVTLAGALFCDLLLAPVLIRALIK